MPISAALSSFLLAALATVSVTNLALNVYNTAGRIEGDAHTIHEPSTNVEATVRDPSGRFEVRKNGAVLLSTHAVEGTQLWSPRNVTDGTHRLGMCSPADNATGPCVFLRAPDVLAASTVYTLPAAPPTEPGQVLSSTTAGVMSWISALNGAVVQIGGPDSIVYINGSAGNLYLNGVAWPSGSPTAAGQLLESTSTGTVEWITQPAYLRGDTISVGSATSSVVLTTQNSLQLNGVYWPFAAPAAEQTLESVNATHLQWVTAPAYISGAVVQVGSASSVVYLNTTAGQLHLNGVAWPSAAPAGTGYLLESTGTASTAWVAAPTYLTSSAVQVGSGSSAVNISSSAGSLLLNGVAWPAAAPTASGQLLESTGPATTAWVTQPTYLTGANVDIGSVSSTVSITSSAGALTLDGVAWPASAPSAGQLLESTGVATTAWVDQPAYLRGASVDIGGASSTVRVNSSGALYLDDVKWPTTAPEAGDTLVATSTNVLVWQQAYQYTYTTFNLSGSLINNEVCDVARTFRQVTVHCGSTTTIGAGLEGATGTIPVGYRPLNTAYATIILHDSTDNWGGYLVFQAHDHGTPGQIEVYVQQVPAGSTNLMGFSATWFTPAEVVP